jgi:hypothetical protein
MYPKKFYADTELRVRNGTAFILMPFATGFREVYDNIAEVLEGEAVAFDCKRADDVFGSGHIIELILRSIGEAEVVIADVTTKNPNVFYELGIAHMVKDLEHVVIITQCEDDVPFDLRPFRYIMYQQNEPGLRKLKRDIVDALTPVISRSYRFSVAEGTTYQFPERLLGEGQYLYDFAIPNIVVGGDAAKFVLEITRHAVQEPRRVNSEAHGLGCGGSIPMHVIPFSLRLEKVVRGVAHFALIAEPRSGQAIRRGPP